MRLAASIQIVAWLDSQMTDQILVSAVTQAEIELGIAISREFG